MIVNQNNSKLLKKEIEIKDIRKKLENRGRFTTEQSYST